MARKLHKDWKDYTEKDIAHIITTICKANKCPYMMNMGAGYNCHKCCGYLLITGHSRGCSPEECTYYLDKKRRRKRQKALTIKD